MAWDACRRGPGPLSQTLGRTPFYVDEVDLAKALVHFDIHGTDTTNMCALLSPVEEEFRDLGPNTPLAITVSVAFHDPAIRSAYNRTYHSSQSFAPTDRLCRGLLRRIKRCTEEFITRKDSDALNPARCLQKGPKPLRFESTFTIQREGYTEPWADVSFRSYQKNPLTGASAEDVLRANHNIVGLFMRRRDPDFEWVDEPARDYFPDKPETFKPSHNGPPNLACIPRALFIERTQAWEFVPGYSLELTLKSSRPARRRPEITRTVKIDSRQTAPLNLGSSEDLLWRAYRFVEDLLGQKKEAFDVDHVNCDGFDGLPDCDCQQFDQNSLRVELRLVNNLGPVFDHLHRSIQSRLRLFTHPEGLDCDEFATRTAARFRQFRNGADNKVDELHDFDFRIADLIGHGWREKNCARFIIDGKQSHSRRTIEALLDRVRTGVSDVLRGHDVAIRMVAYKRGHLILDKALIARDHQETPATGTSASGHDLQEVLIARLKTRIQRCINLICTIDTCNIDDLDVGPSTPERPLRHSRPSFALSRPYTPRSAAPYFSYQTPPGSPANFATRPPTPPIVPVRKSSRVFPLVPERYSEKKEDASDPINTERDSADGIGIGNPRPTTGLRPPSVIREGSREGPPSSENAHGLKPAAEVFAVSRASEYDTDSSSTHSSLPALTESGTASPGQSMLITPSCARSSSPITHGLPFLGSSAEAHQLPASWMTNTSARSSTIIPEVERFVDPKTAVARVDVLSSDRPVTPGPTKADTSAGLNPRDIDAPSGDDKTPLAHRQTQGPTKAGYNVPSPTAPHEINNVGDIISHASNTPEAVAREDEVAYDCSTSATGEQAGNESPEPRDLPTEGWLLCCDGTCKDIENESRESQQDVEAAAAVVECDSSETLKQMPIVQAAEPRANNVMDEDESDSCQLIRDTETHGSDEVEEPRPSEPAEKPDAVPPAGTTEGVLVMTADDLLSRTKFDFFEEDEEDGPHGDEAGRSSDPSGDENVFEMQKPPSASSHGFESGVQIPFTDSGIDIKTGAEANETFSSESDGKHSLCPIDEGGVDCTSEKTESAWQPDEVAAEPESLAASGLLKDECAEDEEETKPTSTSHAGSTASEKSEERSQEPRIIGVPTPSPTADPKPETLLATEASTLTSRTSRPVSNPNPSAYLGLGKARLLSPLSVGASLAEAKPTRNSWSSSSSWEDYISSGRQSSDSVDTIKPSPAASDDDAEDEDDGLDSPKRLGTPTAGLIGLHESCWAEFGIRSALTGSRALGRPSTAPLTDTPKANHIEPQFEETGTGGDDRIAVELDKLSPQRKTVLLKQKKSIGSLISATKAHRLNKKEGRDSNKKHSQEVKRQEKAAKSRPKGVSNGVETTTMGDEDASRFPRAMVIAAGLAFASSFVSRNHS